MKPAKVRHLLEQHGEINRLYLAPEGMHVLEILSLHIVKGLVRFLADNIRLKRKKHGGNTRKNFTEGWVEFEDKKHAKFVAAALNNQPLGGKKTNYYHADIWNIKYLKKFKWEHLTEKNGKLKTQQRIATCKNSLKPNPKLYFLCFLQLMKNG